MPRDASEVTSQVAESSPERDTKIGKTCSKKEMKMDRTRRERCVSRNVASVSVFTGE
jgi:hypothetical protein